MYAKLKEETNSKDSARPSTTKWQCYDGHDSGRVEFPAWLKGCSFMGANNEQVRLSEFLEKSQAFELGEHLNAQKIVYYLVVKEKGTDAQRCGPFSNSSAIQIYVGRTMKGVKQRWCCHRCKVKNVLKEKDKCKNFSMLLRTCRDIQLDHCYLALAQLHSFDMALFVIQDYDTYKEMKDAEKELQRSHAATMLDHGLDDRKG